MRSGGGGAQSLETPHFVEVAQVFYGSKGSEGSEGAQGSQGGEYGFNVNASFRPVVFVLDEM